MRQQGFEGGGKGWNKGREEGEGVGQRAKDCVKVGSRECQAVE